RSGVMHHLIRDRHGLRRSTQVGLARLARSIWVPISGKPEIGVCSAPLRFAAPGTRAKHQPAAVEMAAGSIPLFPIVINNDFCNSHVSLASRAQIFFTAISRK